MTRRALLALALVVAHAALVAAAFALAAFVECRLSG